MHRSRGTTPSRHDKRCGGANVRNLSLLVLLGLSTPALAADPVPAVVGEVAIKYAKVDSIQADFTQVTKSAAFGEDKQAGTMQIKRPKKMRWNFTGEHPK